MDRAAFSTKTRPEFLEDPVALSEHAPEPVCKLRIVRAMRVILIERNGVLNFVGSKIDFYRKAELVERAHDLSIEIRHRTRLQLEHPLPAIILIDPELMGNEIECYFECRTAMWNRR